MKHLKRGWRVLAALRQPQAAISHVRKYYCVFSSLLLLAGPALAAVNVSTTRVVFESGVQQKTVKLVNDGDYPVLVQSWIDDGNPLSTPDNAVHAFMVLPPVLKLLPGEQRELRLMGTGDGLPADRESLYWLNVYQIPPETKTAHTGEKVRLSLRTQLKVLWRPKGVGNPDEKSINLLSFFYESGVIYVKNNSKWNMTLTDLVMGDYSLGGIVVSPGDRQAIFRINTPALRNNKINFATLNDDGNKWGASATIE
ncbi:MAG: fimbria/pilus periplasmic chaperone [Metakosakonia sp.]|nr:fimbria/pilus periplasmic chaperone [Phytobacter sp.]